MILISVHSYDLHKWIVLLCFIITISLRCTETKRIRNVCKENSDCPLLAYCEHNYPTSEFGQCICEEGFIVINDNKTLECYKVATSLGDSCTHKEQCQYTLSTDSDCVFSFCRCNANAHYVDKENTCYKSAMIGEHCRLTNNCVGVDSVCESGVCRCPYGKHPIHNNAECIKDVQLDENCYDDAECVVENSRCHHVCRCAVTHTASKNSPRCLKLATQFEDECEEDVQCQYLRDSVCKNNSCVCKNGYYLHNHKCWISIELTGFCEDDANCFNIPNATCKENRCSCMEPLINLNGLCSSTASHLSLSIIIFILIYSTMIITK